MPSLARCMGVALLPWLALASGAGAQPATPPAAASAPAPTASAPVAELPAVEVRGVRAADQQERRESTASKIVVGRDEIDRYGDSTLGDVLKRLPGVTVQGRTGRGGAIRMRGLGNGYTQILLDGQQLPRGFSLDSLTPDQVERIEILRAPTAETGARAIAGTINIVMREGYRKRINDLRLTAAVEDGLVQPTVAWTRNDVLGATIYNYTLTAFRRDRRDDSTTTTTARRLDDDALILSQRETEAMRDRRNGVHASGRLQWSDEQRVDTITLSPLLVYSTGPTRRAATLTQTVGTTAAPYDTASTQAEGSFSLLRLNGQWNHRTDSAARWEWTLNLGQWRSESASTRREIASGALVRTLDNDGATRNRSLLAAGKFVQLLGGDHSLVAGGDAETNRRTEERRTLQNGTPLLADFGDNLGASTTRIAAYAQDEWNLTPQWAVHAGLRWEGIETRGSGDAGAPDARNRSNVWTPLLHAVYKPAPKSRDQLRISLTRSYRSPTLSNLIARPSLNLRNPVPGPNTPTQPDRAGNPDLRPELATGIDVAAERYLAGGGLLSANVFYRRISDTLRNQTLLEDVPWSPGQPRWVSRPRNVGPAVTQGIELEAKARLSDIVADAPKLDLRANVSVFRSRVRSVPSPDNRLDQQPDATANLGADYRVPGWPLTLGGNLNWTPGYDTRISEVQTAYQGSKTVVDAYGLWVFSPTAQLRVTASNLAARDERIGGSVVDLDAGLRERSRTTSPTDMNLQVRLELKL